MAVVISNHGNPFSVLAPEFDMPRIDDALLDSVIYLYPSADEAQKGESYGGSGFLVLIISKIEPWDGYVYAVTNRHVIADGCTVVRLNKRDGTTEVIPLAQNQWVSHLEADVSVAPINGLSPFEHKVTLIPEEMFLTRDASERLRIGAGDDVYMIGRFIEHDGKQRNQPFVRSGIISLMPTEIEVEWDKKNKPTRTEELFLIEMRSLSGCSGSPVLFSFPLTGSMSPRLTPDNSSLIQRRWLIGIDCAHFNVHEPVYEIVRRKPRTFRKTKYVTPSNAGQMMVVPAWKLRELLDHPRLQTQRKRQEQKRAERKAANPISRDNGESGSVAPS